MSMPLSSRQNVYRQLGAKPEQKLHVKAQDRITD